MQNCCTKYIETGAEHSANCVSFIPKPTPLCRPACGCDYLDYRSFLKYLPELKESCGDKVNAKELEAQIREEISHKSRLFDSLVGVSAGYFSEAHEARYSKIVPSDGTGYLEIGVAVEGSIQVQSCEGRAIPNCEFGYFEGILKYRPCSKPNACFCNDREDECVTSNQFKWNRWPGNCFQVTARFGNACADLAVSGAVKAFVLKRFRDADPLAVVQLGFQPLNNNAAPNEWTTLIAAYKQRHIEGPKWVMV